MSKAFCIWLAALLFVCVATTVSAVRGQQPEPQPSPPEQKILEALDKPTELEFVDQPLSDVIEYLKERHGIEIQVDQKALTEAGLGTDTPITKNIKGIKLASALDLMLGQIDLNYAIHDEVLLITSKTASEKLVTTKAYPILDLLSSDGQDAASRLSNDYESLIELITTSVAPTTWDEVGGRGSIQAFRQAGAIIISQTLQVHRDIEKLLASIRALKRQRAATEPKQAEETVADDETFYVKVYRLPPDWFRSLAMHAPTGGGVSAGAGSAKGAQPTATQASPQIPQKVQPQMGLSSTPTSPAYSTPAELAQAIPAVVRPEAWDVNGGEGSIRAFDFKLLVRQTRPVHRQIEQLLRELD